MEHIIKRWVDALLVRLGFAPEAGAEQWAAFLLMVVLALLFYLVCRLLLVGGMRHIVSRTRVEWDDVLFSGHVMGRLCQLAAVILLYSVTPAVLIGHDAERLTLRVLEILMVVASSEPPSTSSRTAPPGRTNPSRGSGRRLRASSPSSA